MNTDTTILTAGFDRPLGAASAKYFCTFVNQAEDLQRIPLVREVCKPLGITQPVGTHHEKVLQSYGLLAGRRLLHNFSPNPYWVFTRLQASFLVMMTSKQYWTNKELCSLRADRLSDEFKPDLILDADEKHFCTALAKFLSPWALSEVASVQRPTEDQIRFLQVEDKNVRLDPLMWHKFKSVVLAFSEHGRCQYQIILKLCAGLFKKVEQSGFGKGKLDFLRFLWAGRCPWCGSSWDHGRDIQSPDRRYCPACDVTFEMTCPGCRAFGRSLGFSKVHEEYGCDRCGSTWTPEEFAAMFVK